MGKLGIHLRKEDYKIDTKNLLKIVLSTFFGNASPLTDMVVKFIPSSREGTATKVSTRYTGKDQEISNRISKCNPNEILMINIIKLYNKPDCLSFDAFGRVISGTIHKGETVKVLGENYTLDDEEDMAIKNITNLWIHNGRYKVECDKVTAGNWVLIEGIDQSISKTATLTSNKVKERIEIFRPIKHNTISCIKVAIEPIIPSELPKMLEGIRKVNKSYPLLVTKVEESGEHTLLGTGELYMDCMLHDLRKMYSEIEIKVSDPLASFCETVIDTSSIKCHVETNNKKNRLTMLAEPLDKGLAEDIDAENITLQLPIKKISDFFTKKYDWVILSQF